MTRYNYSEIQSRRSYDLPVYRRCSRSRISSHACVLAALSTPSTRSRILQIASERSIPLGVDGVTVMTNPVSIAVPVKFAEDIVSMICNIARRSEIKSIPNDTA